MKVLGLIKNIGLSHIRYMSYIRKHMKIIHHCFRNWKM